MEVDCTKNKLCSSTYHVEQVSPGVWNQGESHQANWMVCVCPPNTFSSSWISPRISRQMPWFTPWSSPTLSHDGTQAELELLVLVSCGIYLWVQCHPLPLRPSCFLYETIHKPFKNMTETHVRPSQLYRLTLDHQQMRPALMVSVLVHAAAVMIRNISGASAWMSGTIPRCYLCYYTFGPVISHDTEKGMVFTWCDHL